MLRVVAFALIVWAASVYQRQHACASGTTHTASCVLKAYFRCHHGRFADAIL